MDTQTLLFAMMYLKFTVENIFHNIRRVTHKMNTLRNDTIKHYEPVHWYMALRIMLQSVFHLVMTSFHALQILKSLFSNA